ncbi:MAG: DUF202 domain-containing protein [Bacteroidales bacterium]|nr:DUF202 domain-containing protein [Bacteroidales bacterium]
MLHSKFQLKEELILRDYLAIERTRLANERTLFAYIRTALYLILGGIAFMQMNDFKTIKWLAPLCFTLSLIILITGIAKFLLMKKSLKKFYATWHYDEVRKEK